jgi:hypothetical protein
MAEREIDIIMRALQRMAEKQGIGVGDLVTELESLRKTMDGSG